MTPLPLTVISGYLGAGKTTLINKMLAGSHGLRLMVMVNDFGAINIDQALIVAQDKDVIALTNGCVCCTMGTDLFMAFNDALDQRPRPDHLIIEASGIADPKAIANTAIAEPDLRYAGIITLVDALNIKDLLTDTLVAPQVRQQIVAADLVVQTKRDSRDADLDAIFDKNGLEPPDLIDFDVIQLLTLPSPVYGKHIPMRQHSSYISWQDASKKMLNFNALRDALELRPKGLYRMKGFVRTDRGVFEIHIVGKQFDIRPLEDDIDPSIVALGLRDRVTQEEIANWWHAIAQAP